MRDESENKNLDIVKEKILTKINGLGEVLATKRKGVLDVRKEMWREARIVLRDFDDVADLTIFTEEVARHERQYFQASEEVKKLRKLLDSPYFARIDFTETGYEVEKLYIGRHSFFDDDARIFHVYDWRAPISSLYYDFGTGEASFTVPGTGAVITGEISLKRQYQIEKGELVYLFDNELAIEDDILRLELSKASEARIKIIINTIQSDQNRAIRSESRNIFVYGPAGSGKTSVGLHRMAYLLYRHRNSLSSAKVRIFSPSEIFSSYIQGIIPELGEEDVLTLDFTSLLGKAGNSRGGRAFRSQYQMIEHLTSEPDDIRTNWIKIKFSKEFLDGLENLISSYQPTFEDIIFYNNRLCDAKRLKSLYQNRTITGTLASKTERVFSFVNQCFNEYLNSNFRNVAEIFNTIHDDNFSDGVIRAKFETEKNIFLADIRNRSFPTASKIYEKFLRHQSKNLSISATPVCDALRIDKVFFEDALVLFYIDLLTGRIPCEKNIKHILLDEAQDLSLLHHKILQKLYPASDFTVLADVNQAIHPEININDMETLESLYPQAENIELSKSYRSTFEITSFASSFLKLGTANVNTSEAFLRNGEKPVILQSTDPIAAVIDILNGLSSDYNTVGILFPTILEAREFHTKFKKIFSKVNTLRPLNFITAESSNFAPGIMIIAAPFAKGLEFDVVICPVYRPPQNVKEQKMLYLICTRALHRLFLLS